MRSAYRHASNKYALYSYYIEKVYYNDINCTWSHFSFKTNTFMYRLVGV